MADRLRDLAVAARHQEIQSELKWLAESYDRLADRMENSQSLFAGEIAAGSEAQRSTAAD